MADLRCYLEKLRSTTGQLYEVTRPVAFDREVPSLVKALELYGKPAVLFHDVVGSELPLVMGVFGTRDRIAEALGVDRRRALEHVLRLLDSDMPAPVTVPDAPVDEVFEEGKDIDLGRFPIGVHSRDDAGAYITSGVVIARDPLTGAINTGMYRIMITGSRTMTINAAPDHDLGRIFRSAAKAGTDVDVAVVLGHHPAYFIASQLKNPVHVDTHRVAGALLGSGLRVAPGRTIDLPVPADAEIVLEARVEPTRREQEGPFGEFTYYYGAATAPVCTVTAVRRRQDAIFHDLHPTHDEHRCLWLFPGREARLLEACRRVVPGTVDVRIPFYGGSLSAYVSVRKVKEGDGSQVMLAAFASDHFLKHVVVVDDDVNVHDDAAVLWAANVRVQATTDLTVMPSMKGIRMDPSASPRGETGDRLSDKVGVDATRPLYTSFPERADLPHHGYETIDVSEYLSAEDMETVVAAKGWRRRFEE